LERAAGRPESALASQERALELTERMAAADPKDPDMRARVAIAVGRVGEVHVLGTWQLEKALPYYLRTYEIFDGLVAEVPNNSDYLRGRSFARLTIGELLNRTGRHREALQEIEPELIALDRARRADPADGLAPLAYGAALNYAGEARLGLGQFGEADRTFTQAAEYLGPDLVEAGAELAVVYAQMLAGRAQALAGQAAARGDPGALALRSQAQDFARRAIVVLEPLAKGGNVAREATRLLGEARRVLDGPPAAARVAADTTGTATARGP
jgi:tetratricopeptide (TPR) repeat protein